MQGMDSRRINNENFPENHEAIYASWFFVIVNPLMLNKIYLKRC